MALNVHVTRINANPTADELPSRIGKPDYGAKNSFDWASTTKINPSASALVNVPEDRDIRKFPVRIFEIQAEV
jgi:hypothetical protein